MNLSLNKNTFVNYLLNPVSKLADNLLLEFDTEGSKPLAKTLVSSSDNSVILLSNIECEVSKPTKCVIPDCKTFLRLFSNIENDKVVLLINDNSIQYKQPNGFSFKYHLLDESYIINKKSINESKLNDLNFDTKFVLTKQKLSEIIKFNSIVPDAEKLYFFSEKKSIAVKLGDEQKANTNEIVTEVASCFEGEALKEPIPIHIQNILLFSFAEDTIEVSINQSLKVFKFETKSLKYIVSGLVK
jgi:hypothetical protein